jgi:uncharacterized protein DUF7009
VEETAQFSAEKKLQYRIQTGAGTDIRAELTGGTITITVPVGDVAAWATSDEVGLNARDGDLRIALEKDFRCCTGRTEQDKPNAYPHPAERSNVS